MIVILRKVSVELSMKVQTVYQVSDIGNLDLPIDGINVSLQGKLYYRIVNRKEKNNNAVNCYITDSSEYDALKLCLSDNVGETVVNEDETFGMMVGGEFAYCGLNAQINCVVRRTERGFVSGAVKYLKLEKDDKTQEFSF